MIRIIVRALLAAEVAADLGERSQREAADWSGRHADTA